MSILDVSTMFRCVCPECGSVSRMVWQKAENIVMCPYCHARFDYRANSYRPVTGGMSDEERAEHYRYREHCREYDKTPARLEAHAFRSRRYYREHREEILAKKRERYALNRDEINAKRRADYAANAKEIREKRRKHYAEHRDELLAKRRACTARKIATALHA